MFKVQAAKQPTISKEYVKSSQTEHLWGDFMKQIGSYARKSNVIKNQKNRTGSGQCWYNNSPSSAL